MHTKLDAVITVSSSKTSSCWGLARHGGIGGSLLSRLIGAMVKGIILRGTGIEFKGRDTCVPLMTILQQLGRVQEDNRVCTVNKLGSEPYKACSIHVVYICCIIQV